MGPEQWRQHHVHHHVLLLALPGRALHRGRQLLASLLVGPRGDSSRVSSSPALSWKCITPHCSYLQWPPLLSGQCKHPPRGEGQPYAYFCVPAHEGDEIWEGKGPLRSQRSDRPRFWRQFWWVSGQRFDRSSSASGLCPGSLGAHHLSAGSSHTWPSGETQQQQAFTTALVLQVMRAALSARHRLCPGTVVTLSL